MTIKPYTVTTNDGKERHYMEPQKAHNMLWLLKGLYPELKPELTIKEVKND